MQTVGMLSRKWLRNANVDYHFVSSSGTDKNMPNKERDYEFRKYGKRYLVWRNS